MNAKIFWIPDGFASQSKSEFKRKFPGLFDKGLWMEVVNADEYRYLIKEPPVKGSSNWYEKRDSKLKAILYQIQKYHNSCLVSKPGENETYHMVSEALNLFEPEY